MSAPAPRRQRVRAAVGVIWRRWLIVAHVIGNFQARVLLTVFYFVVVPPFAVVVKLGRDPLTLRAPGGDSFWIARPETPVNGRKQF